MCVAGSPLKRLQRWPNVAREVTFARLQISGRDLRNLTGETTGNAKHVLVKSRENTGPEVMIKIRLNHIPGIQKWQQ